MAPVFVIHDIEQEFHTAYNTAAKSVAILHDLVREIPNRQNALYDNSVGGTGAYTALMEVEE